MNPFAAAGEMRVGLRPGIRFGFDYARFLLCDASIHDIIMSGASKFSEEFGGIL